MIDDAESLYEELKEARAEKEELRTTLQALYGTFGVTLAFQRKWPKVNRKVLDVLKETAND